ncbi:hypothetical protein IQ63_04700, partial [Streptomyces acidiscabies]
MVRAGSRWGAESGLESRASGAMPELGPGASEVMSELESRVSEVKVSGVKVETGVGARSEWGPGAEVGALEAELELGAA